MTHPFIRTFIRLREVDSTSTHARRLLAAERDVALPLLVWADRQTAGRGRGGNAWWSDEGSLTFTVAIDPVAHGLILRRVPTIALSLGVFLINAFVSKGWLTRGRAGIRWPNDIEIEGRKLAGILLEHIHTPRGARLLMGIGINVSTRFEAAPSDVQALATSLKAQCPEAPAHSDVLEAALAAVEKSVHEVATENEEQAFRWNEKDLLCGEPVKVDLGDRVVTGTGLGIDFEGRLILTTDGGELMRVAGGRVLRT